MDQPARRTVAVVGLYRSGSSALAGVLQQLGVDMGAPFFGDYFEPADLSATLRRWWDEPHLQAAFEPAEAIQTLRQWCQQRPLTSPLVGAKHPLLSLMTGELREAWGPTTRFLWSVRDLQASCASLRKLGWWPDSDAIQQRLWQALQRFRDEHHPLEVSHDALRGNPQREVDRIAEFLELDVSPAIRRQAAATIRPAAPRPASPGPPPAPQPLRMATAPSPSPPIVATMLCGNRESMVGDAIASVIPWVDTLLLLDTGITDRSLEIACEIAGDKLAVVSYPWRNDFAAARNAALDFAEQLDADWALTIDTDERLRFPPDCSRADWDASLAAAPPVAAWLVPDQQRGYAKERLIRLPAAGRWRGETHEAFILNRTARRDRHPWLTFWELAKTPEQMQHKLSRDLQILQRLTANDPDNGRWWFYLGQTLEGLHRHAEAQAAFEQSFPLETWGEQAAWAAYCAARCAFEQGAYAESIDRCSMGLAVQPQSPELLWLAGLCALRRRQLSDAICWSELAAHLGSRPELITFRIAFRHLPAWFEGPHDVLRFAYRAAGNRRAAEQAEADYAERRQERLQLHPAEYAATEDPAAEETPP